MKIQQNKRMRGRINNNRRTFNPLTRNYESNGPDVKVRGNAQHIVEKYHALSRDAQASGDYITAENYMQHAEHYMRIILSSQIQITSNIVHDKKTTENIQNPLKDNENEQLLTDEKIPILENIPIDTSFSNNTSSTTTTTSEEILEDHSKSYRSPRKRFSKKKETENSSTKNSILKNQKESSDEKKHNNAEKLQTKPRKGRNSAKIEQTKDLKEQAGI